MRWFLTVCLLWKFVRKSRKGWGNSKTLKIQEDVLSRPSFGLQLDLKLGESLHNSNLGSVSQCARSKKINKKTKKTKYIKNKSGFVGNKRTICYIVHMTGLTFISLQWLGAEVKRNKCSILFDFLAGECRNRKIHPSQIYCHFMVNFKCFKLLYCFFFFFLTR